MAGLTFVNQVGAVEGMNQAAPGTLIPDTFVRWSQDVLFDRAGLMRRRGPFEKFKMYNADNTENTTAFVEAGAVEEYVLGVFSTYDPTGTPRIAMIINSYNGSLTKTIIRVFDNHFKFLGKEVLFTDGTNIGDSIENLSVVSAKPALGGGLWITFAGIPADPTKHYQMFWRGGYGSATQTGTFATETVTGLSSEHKGISKTISGFSSRTGISVGQFVYANNYFLGTVKEVPSGTSTIILEKRPFLWDTTVDNNHATILTPNNLSSSSGVATIRVNEAMLFEVGDVVVVNTGTIAYNGTFTITAINTTPAIGAQTFSYNLGSSPATVTSPTGTIRMDKDLSTLTLSQSLKFYSVRPYYHVHGRGLLSITDAGGNTIISGSEGTSGDGHWSAADVTGYNLYRASDNLYLGKVKDTLTSGASPVSSNTTGHLNSDCGIALNGEEYIMAPLRAFNMQNTSNDMIVSNRTSNEFSGLYTAVYAGYQWYGNVANQDQDINRVVFSASHDREAVDLSTDAADSIVFPGKSQFRGLGSSSAGLLVFLEDRTYILRGNDRTNFSVEQLVPEGCLCASSIVEYGGGVFWAGKSGIMFFDGASVRNLTKDNLGLYYTDSLDNFNPEYDRVMGFIHKNNLIMSFTSWTSPFDPVRYEPIYAADWQNTEGIADRAWNEFDPDFDYDDFFTQNNTPIYWDRQILNNPEEAASTGVGIVWKGGSTISGSGTWKSGSNIQKWGPLRKQTSITFCLYLPSNALTTLSNMDFRGMTSIETVDGLKTIVGVNSVESSHLRTRLIDIHPVFDTNTNGEDDLLIEKINIPYTDLITGPDFYLQTKHFTVGDPILRKWFQRIMLNMLLYDGAIRMDLVDDDDNDEVDINKKKHRYWEVFTEKGYDWDYLGAGEGINFGVQFPKITSPNKSNWYNVEAAAYLWDELFTADFNRYAKRLSWRKGSIGLRLYQLNDYKKPFNGVVTRPNRVEIQGFSIGFKALRQGRV